MANAFRMTDMVGNTIEILYTRGFPILEKKSTASQIWNAMVMMEESNAVLIWNILCLYVVSARMSNARMRMERIYWMVIRIQ